MLQQHFLGLVSYKKEFLAHHRRLEQKAKHIAVKSDTSTYAIS